MHRWDAFIPTLGELTSYCCMLVTLSRATLMLYQMKGTVVFVTVEIKKFDLFCQNAER